MDKKTSTLNTGLLTIDPEKTASQLADFIGKSVSGLHRDGVILGLSGGLDSSVVAALSVRAVGKKKVMGLIMPEKEGTPGATDDALLAAKWLGIKTKIVDISKSLASLGIYRFILSRIPTRMLKSKLTTMVYKVFNKLKGENPFLYSLKGSENKLIAQGVAHFKSKHRMRMVLVYFFAESRNLLVAGSANRSEELTGAQQ